MQGSLKYACLVICEGGGVSLFSNAARRGLFLAQQDRQDCSEAVVQAVCRIALDVMPVIFYLGDAGGQVLAFDIRILETL